MIFEQFFARLSRDFRAIFTRFSSDFHAIFSRDFRAIFFLAIMSIFFSDNFLASRAVRYLRNFRAIFFSQFSRDFFLAILSIFFSDNFLAFFLCVKFGCCTFNFWRICRFDTFLLLNNY